jgi:hypothetical protein
LEAQQEVVKLTVTHEIGVEGSKDTKNPGAQSAQSDFVIFVSLRVLCGCSFF